MKRVSCRERILRIRHEFIFLHFFEFFLSGYTVFFFCICVEVLVQVLVFMY